jgi:hypothetical protein
MRYTKNGLGANPGTAIDKVYTQDNNSRVTALNRTGDNQRTYSVERFTDTYSRLLRKEFSANTIECLFDGDNNDEGPEDKRYYS